VTTAAEDLGLVNSYEEPQRMGVDRWLAMAGARGQGEGPFCVVDAGTAITVDQVDGDGRHLGGWIVPGPALAAGALFTGTARIPQELADAAPSWGCSTAECVAAGMDQALRGLGQRIVAAGMELHGAAIPILGTGGDGERLLQWLGPDAKLAPDLVLEGLARWVEAHAPSC